MFSPPADSRQLILVTSPAYRPARSLATLRTYARTSNAAPWHPVFGAWTAEIGRTGLNDHKHEGDGSTPTGTFPVGLRMYGNDRNPGGLHYRYHRLVCGDWWDEDPYSATYNRFVHVACGTTPSFAAWSEALWTETVAYPYFAVIETNNDPVVRGRDAPGSGIFLHHSVGGPTAGCVALPLSRLVAVLRWLRPGDHPVVEIGTTAEVGHIPVSPEPGREQGREVAR